jgi:hypothetical protein
MDPISALPLAACVWVRGRALPVLHLPRAINALKKVASGHLEISAKRPNVQLARSMEIASFLVVPHSRLALLVSLSPLMAFSVNGMFKHSHVTLVASGTLLMSL